MQQTGPPGAAPQSISEIPLGHQPNACGYQNINVPPPTAGDLKLHAFLMFNAQFLVNFVFKLNF